MAELAAVLVGDPAELWEGLGFVVDDGAVHVSGVRHQLGGTEKGLRDWSVRGLPDGVMELDGFAFGLPVPERAEPTPAHPNGITGLDHVVMSTPDLFRTIDALEEAGIELRRERDAGTAAAPRRQAFFWLGEVILELVGSPRASGDGPPRLSGLAFASADLDGTAAYLGERLRPAKDAVQPGRRIATLDRSVGSTVAIAVMSPHPG